MAGLNGNRIIVDAIAGVFQGLAMAGKHEGISLESSGTQCLEDGGPEVFVVTCRRQAPEGECVGRVFVGAAEGGGYSVSVAFGEDGGANSTDFRRGEGSFPSATDALGAGVEALAGVTPY